MSQPFNIHPPSDLPRLPARPRDGHKGTFGAVAIIGGRLARPSEPGETTMIGAPALAATAALRAGAGLAKLVMPAPILGAGLVICPSATGIPLAVDEATGQIIAHEAARTLDAILASTTVLAIGPGLGASDGARALTLRAIQQETLPVVADADALNCLAHMPDLFRDFHAAAVLTPHPGEFRRLCAGLGLKSDLGLDASRERACEHLAQRLGRIVGLKGAGTVVSDGLRTWTCSAGHPCLATAGTGDVLTGIIAGLISQFVPLTLDLFDAARVGVWVHATAGEQWAATHDASAGLLAMELADLVPGVMESLRRQ